MTFDVPFNSPKVADITEVITRFVKRGGKVIDTSPSYGNAESLIGQIAGKSGLTDSLFIATKVRARGREAGIAQIEQSLGRFHRAKIDLIQVHNLVDVDAQMSGLRCAIGRRMERSGIPELLTQSRRALPKSRET